MENIFNHSPTADELTNLFGANIEEREYLRFRFSGDTENGRLYRLFELRGKRGEASKYLSRIKDEQYRFDVAMVDVITDR